MVKIRRGWNMVGSFPTSKFYGKNKRLNASARVERVKESRNRHYYYIRRETEIHKHIGKRDSYADGGKRCFSYKMLC